MQRDSTPSRSPTPGAAVFAGASSPGPDPSLSDDAVGHNGLFGSGAVVDMGALVPGHSAQGEEPCTRISNRPPALPMPTLPLPASAAPSTARGGSSGDNQAGSASDGRSREHHPIVHATAHNIMPLGRLIVRCAEGGGVAGEGTCTLLVFLTGIWRLPHIEKMQGYHGM
jgi:hypothetical protein